jgi:hypothetical protein
VALAVAVVLGAGAVVLLRWGQSEPPEEIEGLRLGQSAADAQAAVEGRGYVWVPGVPALPDADGLVVEVADAWLKLFDPRWVEPRYNWIGVKLTRPPGAAPAIGCVTRIVTVASEERPETNRLTASDPRSVCGKVWAAKGAAS